MKMERGRLCNKKDKKGENSMKLVTCDDGIYIQQSGEHYIVKNGEMVMVVEKVFAKEGGFTYELDINQLFGEVLNGLIKDEEKSK